MSIQFYTNPMSRGQIARWALHEVGADYNEVLLEYGSTMKAPEYLALNPMGKVPAIVHGDTVVTEAAAICLYLGDAFPDAGIGPRDLSERAQMLRWTFFAAGPLETAISNRSMGWDVGDDPKKQGTLGYGSYEQVLSVLRGLFEGRDYVCGDRFTAADVYVGAQVDWGLLFKTIPESPSLLRYAERLRERAGYKASKAIDNEHIQRIKASESQ